VDTAAKAAREASAKAAVAEFITGIRFGELRGVLLPGVVCRFLYRQEETWL
jgi:hypothetical protein